MKNIRLFIISSSILLSAWLGASFVTEVQTSPKQEKTAKSSQKELKTASEDTPSEETKAPLPIAHFE